MSFKLWIETKDANGLDRIYTDHPLYGSETVGNFLSRHKIPINSDGTFILYHGRPKGSNYKELRAGTYLTNNQEDAKFFAARDRNLNPDKDIEVIKLKLSADEIEPGIHITLKVSKKI